MNEEYYVLENGEKTGPFSYKELAARGIDLDTPVSTSADDDWQNASYLPEFNEYFESKGYYFPTEENLAGFGWRTLAFIIDYLLIAVAVMFIGIKTGWVTLPPPTASFSASMSMLSQKSLVFIEISFAAIYLVYNILFELIDTQGSIGKKICSLKVVDADGRKPTFINSFIRTVGALTAFNILGLLILISSFFFSDRKQAWYDRLVKTYIIRSA